MNNINNKIIVILGPTASGKSSVAIKLAKKFNGEIISSDSRQIYRGMEINSGAVPVSPINAQATHTTNRNFVYKTYALNGDVPHYFIGITDPTEEYSVAKFKRQSEEVIANILKRKKVPIICGGTGFWIKAIVDNMIFPKVKPNWSLREKLSKESTEQLFDKLKKIDSERAKTIDRQNKVRLIRALEICEKLGKVPVINLSKKRNWEFLQIGIQREKENLRKRIKLNVKTRMKQGMIAEIKKLHSVLSWEKIESFGLSFKLIPQYLKGEIASLKKLEEKIYLTEKNYAKRQITWFNKDKRIKWLSNYNSIEKEVSDYLRQ